MRDKNAYEKDYRAKNPEVFKAIRRRFWKRHKGRLMQKRRAAIAANSAFVREVKTGRPCADCGGRFHPAAMDFDHQPGTKKVRGGVSALARHGTTTKAVLIREMWKCDLVCANCHRVRTFTRRQEQRIRAG
jgi:hypothetical protein